MHKKRAKLLQPLEGSLSPQHFPGLRASISLELGNIHRHGRSKPRGGCRGRARARAHGSWLRGRAEVCKAWGVPGEVPLGRAPAPLPLG